MNIFSGDSLERCLYVVKRLNFSKADFSRSGEYFHLNFKSEARANIEVKRVFDSIYDVLKRADITEKNSVRIEIEKTKAENEVKDGDGKEKKKKGAKIDKLSNDLLEGILEQVMDVQETIPKKTLLLSGSAAGVIMNSKHLTNCLKAITYMSDCIIMHSAQPVHC